MWKCLTCEEIKTKHQHPARELGPLGSPTWKWDFILMGFVTGLSLASSYRSIIWVNVNRLTKSIHFIPTRGTWCIERLNYTLKNSLTA